MTFSEKITPGFFVALQNSLKTRLNSRQRIAPVLLAKEADEIGIKDVRQFAYILATCWWECGFLSIPERKAKEGTRVWEMQKKYWHTGFYGRGYCQLTWEANYRRFSPIVGADLVANPDKVLEPQIGAKILVYGMAHGLFSGVSLSKYFQEGKEAQWEKARRIVNGNYRAKDVARIAQGAHFILAQSD